MTARWESRVVSRSAKGAVVYALNVVGKRDTVVTVKDRGPEAGGSPSRRFLCLGCVSNSCPHAVFVRDEVEGAVA